MREYIQKNLRVIKKHLKKRKTVVSKLNMSSIIEEYKEWGEDQFIEEQSIWTLPDLTRVDRFKNFCRSIKKEIK